MELSEAGTRAGTDRFMALIYDDLRRIAASYLRDERPDHTLRPTAVVHEAYIKLVQLESVDWKNRAQFMSVASRIMRNVLVDYARMRNAKKRGANPTRVSLSSEMPAAGDEPDGVLEVIALHDALDALHEESARAARVAEMRIFAGMTPAEIAEIEGVSERTTHTDWVTAKMWIARELGLSGD